MLLVWPKMYSNCGLFFFFLVFVISVWTFLNFYFIWLGLFSLFNGISTFVGYLMPKLFSQKNRSGAINP